MLCDVEGRARSRSQSITRSRNPTQGTEIMKGYVRERGCKALAHAGTGANRQRLRGIHRARNLVMLASDQTGEFALCEVESQQSIQLALSLRVQGTGTPLRSLPICQKLTH
jgi:hypothetical protein